jgi:hypothetical protein
VCFLLRIISNNIIRDELEIIYADGKTVHRRSVLGGMAFGIAGGVIGTVLMDIVMMLTFLIADQPVTAFFSMVGEKLGYGVLAGVAAHNLVGLTGGLVFSLLVLFVAPLRIDSRRRGLLLGIGAGALTIPLGCIPLAIWLGQPITVVISFSVLPHLVWGAVLGWIVGYGLLAPHGSHITSEVQNP